MGRIRHIAITASDETNGSWYYYHLDLTLFAKSLALIGSGALFLTARAWLQLRFRRLEVA